MGRLAGLNEPPDDFWKIYKNPKIEILATINNAHSFHTTIINQLQ